MLDVVTHIQRALDPTLAYRFACRVGMCGSCAMTVNGARALDLPHACGQGGRGRMRSRSRRSRNLPVVRDLVTDMREFFDKWARAQGQLRAAARTRKDAFAAGSRPPTRSAARGRCRHRMHRLRRLLRACDVVAWNPDYLGPAALNRAWTLVNDVRDGGRAERLRAVAGDAGCHACHTHMTCTERCPKQISPTAAIAGLKRAAWRLAALQGKL